MNCPHCGEAVHAGDAFCEGCGKPLSLDASPAPAAGPVCPACQVAADEEGFCTNCGVLLVPRQRDHIEETKGRNLLGAVTDRGKQHHRNEDDFAVEVLKGCVVAVVCDGVSKSQDPDLASRQAARSGRDVMVNAVRSGLMDPQAAMQDAMQTALQAVCALPYIPPKSDDDLPAPSCTFVGALLEDGGHITVGCVGDARAFFIGTASAKQLTRDDSWMQEAIESGMDPQAAANHKDAHGVTRWLGVDTDTDGPFTVKRLVLPSSGYLILCSDGLWNYAETAEAIAALVRSQPAKATPVDIARALVDYANSRGGADNITVVVVKVTI